MTAPAEVRVVTKEEGRVVLEIFLYEGRNRQIRKMCEIAGLEVIKLKRIAIGAITLGNLKLGSWRRLTKQQVEYLKVSCGMKK